MKRNWNLHDSIEVIHVFKIDLEQKFSMFYSIFKVGYEKIQFFKM